MYRTNSILIEMRQDYVGKCVRDIVRFIDEILLTGNDPMMEGRV